MLLGNYSVLNRSPMRFLAGGTATPEVGSRANWQQNGNGKNRQYVSMTTAANRRFSLPYGSYPPYATLMPQKGGDMSARRSADFAIASTATGVLGMPGAGASSFVISIAPASILPTDDSSPLRTGSASFAITTNTPDGQLISSGSGTANFSITTNNPQLTASVDGAGSASFAITTNTPLLGALANGQGSATITVSASSSGILPADDTSPLRTGSANFSFSGSLVSYAVGYMSGSTEVTTVLTTDSISRAVWAAIAATNNDAGTMGAKLNTASSGGVDYSAMADAIRTELAAELARIDANVSSRSTPGDIFAAV